VSGESVGWDVDTGNSFTAIDSVGGTVTLKPRTTLVALGWALVASYDSAVLFSFEVRKSESGAFDAWAVAHHKAGETSPVV
jgi:hypothetical protein